MTTKMGLIRIGIILLFVIAFTTIGWALPSMYAAHAPEEQFVEVHNFEAENATTGDDSHLLCLDRTMKRSTTGTTFTELYLVGDSGERIELESDTSYNYFQEGRHTVVTPHELPDNLDEGTYRYVLIIKMDMANDRVTRTFTYESDPFTISSESNSTTVDEFNCG